MARWAMPDAPNAKWLTPHGRSAHVFGIVLAYPKNSVDLSVDAIKESQVA